MLFAYDMEDGGRCPWVQSRGWQTSKCAFGEAVLTLPWRMGDPSTLGQRTHCVPDGGEGLGVRGAGDRSRYIGGQLYWHRFFSEGGDRHAGGQNPTGIVRSHSAMWRTDWMQWGRCRETG